MRGGARILGVLIALALIIAVSSTGYALSETEMEGRLVSGSPWTGTWWRKVDSNGNLDVVFEIKGAELQGRIENTSGTHVNFEGPVTNLKVRGEDNEVIFNSRTGALYRLKLKGDRLNGTSASPWGTVHIKLRQKNAK